MVHQRLARKDLEGIAHKVYFEIHINGSPAGFKVSSFPILFGNCTKCEITETLVIK